MPPKTIDKSDSYLWNWLRFLILPLTDYRIALESGGMSAQELFRPDVRIAPGAPALVGDFFYHE